MKHIAFSRCFMIQERSFSELNN